MNNTYFLHLLRNSTVVVDKLSDEEYSTVHIIDITDLNTNFTLFFLDLDHLTAFRDWINAFLGDTRVLGSELLEEAEEPEDEESAVHNLTNFISDNDEDIPF